MKNESNVFQYTYSATQQEEIKKIRAKYAPSAQEEDKMERLRRLDESAARPGTVAALILGIISTLIFGVGMCCTMVWTKYFVVGIVIGMIGIIGIVFAYPLYVKITKKRREKIAPKILHLTDELMK